MDADSSTSGAAAGAANDLALHYRAPVPADAPSLHALVGSSPPLDPNSTYAYLLIGLHFAGTSVVAERDGEVVGLVTAYLDPSEPEVVFVWQVAVSTAARGLGLGKGMLRQMLARPACSGVRAIETTITPSNEASWRLFRGLARELGATVSDVDVFRGPDVGGTNHEEERLIRIAPVSPVRHGDT